MWTFTKIFFLFATLFICLPYATAQEINRSLPQSLAQTLQELKNSAEQLSSSNEMLASKDVQMRGRLKELDIVLKKLMDENRRLNELKAKLQKIDPVREKQMANLKSEIMDLDKNLSEMNAQAKTLNGKIGEEQKKEEELNLRLQPTDKSSAAPSDVLLLDASPSDEAIDIWQQKQKERLAVLKLISDSQNHQKLLHEKILDLQKVNDFKAIEIEQIKNEIAQLHTQTKFSSDKDFSPQEIAKLEASIKDLEKNRDELQSLVQKMQQKAQKTATFQASKDELKFKSRIGQLKTETKNLRVDLEELQQQMVELDKRKAYLEALLQK